MSAKNERKLIADLVDETLNFPVSGSYLMTYSKTKRGFEVFTESGPVYIPESFSFVSTLLRQQEGESFEVNRKMARNLPLEALILLKAFKADSIVITGSGSEFTMFTRPYHGLSLTWRKRPDKRAAA